MFELAEIEAAGLGGPAGSAGSADLAGSAGLGGSADLAGSAGPGADTLENKIIYALGYHMMEGHSFYPMRDFCIEVSEYADVISGLVRDTVESMAFNGKLMVTRLSGREVVYFYSYYKAENYVAGKLANLADFRLKPIRDVNSFIKKYESEKGIRLSEKQKLAVKGCLAGGVSVITGGPGTGKTTILNCIVDILMGQKFKVAVCAPTGRAAKRIMETGGYPAVTIHRLLEYYYDEVKEKMQFGKTEENPLDLDAIVVDECSMIDLKLMEALTKATKLGTRLILVGDSDQLPSVGAGNVLRDLIESDYFYTARLTEIYRQAMESEIITAAHAINRGEHPEIDSFDGGAADGMNVEAGGAADGAESGADLLFISAKQQADIQDAIVETAVKFNLDEVQILTPVKKKILGTESLNQRLQAVFNPPAADKAELKYGKKYFRVGDRVMQIKNDYSLSGGVFNGEIGIVKGIDTEDKTVTVMYENSLASANPSEKEYRFIEYEYIKLEELELAYAVTVHKSQGSEYKAVIIPISWFPPVLATRSLIYTAITRGKEKVILIGERDYLNAMVDNDRAKYRLSGLKERLCNILMGTN